MASFGRWTINKAEGRYTLCTCECGTVRRVATHDLKAGKSTSCGCLRIERAVSAVKLSNRTHGMEKSPEYRIWIDMRRRCHDERRPDFKNYGARGVTVCEEWRNSFEAFYRDMGPRPPGTTLDRLQNAGPYSPQNCVWAARKTQERNKRSNRIVEYQGQRMTLTEAAERAGVNYYTAHGRLSRGWSLERALTPA